MYYFLLWISWVNAMLFNLKSFWGLDCGKSRPTPSIPAPLRPDLKSVNFMRIFKPNGLDPMRDYWEEQTGQRLRNSMLICWVVWKCTAASSSDALKYFVRMFVRVPVPAVLLNVRLGGIIFFWTGSPKCKVTDANVEYNTEDRALLS